MSIPTFQLLDGIHIPWLAWGNGTGVDGSQDAIEKGILAIESGINHLDTAQAYKTESETGESVKRASVSKDQVYVTSKLSYGSDQKSISLDRVRPTIEESTNKLGFIPDLYLIHNPFVAAPGELKQMWKIFEDLKDEGKLKSIGVSNFRPQDFEAILPGAKYKPVVNQIEFHPYVLAHLEPLLKHQKEHGIVTASFGIFSLLTRHPTGGPLKPVLERIAKRLTLETGKTVDSSTVILLWARALGVIAVTASGNPHRIQWLAEAAKMPDILTSLDIDEINRVGKTIHFRHYKQQMEKDFPVPDLPSQ